MSDDKIINHMVEFVERQERQLQVDKLLRDNKAKSDVVNNIITELKQVIGNENTEN